MRSFFLVAGFGITLVGLLLFSNSHSAAQTTGFKSRTKTVEIQVVQYVWQLINSSNGRLICEVNIEHEGLPTLDELMNTCYQEILPPERTPTPSTTLQPGGTPQPTSVPFNLSEFYSHVFWKLKETLRITRTVQVPLPDIIVDISAPQKLVKKPYVILMAYDPVWDYTITAIHGTLNYQEFVCNTSRCEVPVETDSTLTFYATSSSGDNSQTVQATLRVTRADGGYSVTITSSIKTSFTDSCANIWGVQPGSQSGWAVFPRTPELLNTNKTLHFLAGKLITTGIVNASACPGGGLFFNGAPNACGLEAARTEMVRWQNQFDPVIWSSGRDIGIPPRLIKTLIEVESQFWPANTRYNLIEFGFGQLTQVGADVALRWDPDLFQQVCNGLLYNCNVTYKMLPPWLQATVAGGLLKMINAECVDCANNMDLPNAAQSLPILARTIRSNCNQVKSFITQPEQASASYEDMWKFTIVSYHNGYQCLLTGLDAAKENKEPLDWAHVGPRIECQDSQAYVDDVWNRLAAFDAYLLPPSDPDQPVLVPYFSPTPTPTITPTPVLARSHLTVLVYVDSNHDQIPQPGEMVNDLEVVLTFEDGSTRSQVLANGVAAFDLAGQQINSDAQVSIPFLFRTQTITIPASGEVRVDFRLEEPVFPRNLP